MKCGNCKHEHTTADEVKECYRRMPINEVKRTPPPQDLVSGPTANQRNFLAQLLEQTGKTEDDLELAPDMMTFSMMSDTIGTLVAERKELGKRSSVPTRLPSNIKGTEVMQGTYTVVFSDREGDYITLRFRAPQHGKWRGTQLVEFLYGPDNNNDYRRCANWTDDGYRVWAEFKETSRIFNGIKFMAEADKEAQIQIGETYALKSGNCWRCGRTLTREDSITRGMGAKCAGIVLG